MIKKELVHKAKDLKEKHGSLSMPLLQQKLKLSFHVANKLIERLKTPK